MYVLACFRVLLGRKLCTSLLILTMKGRIRWLGVLFLACREIDARLGRGLQTSSIKARRMPTEANLKDMPLCCVKNIRRLVLYSMQRCVSQEVAGATVSILMSACSSRADDGKPRPQLAGGRKIYYHR